jgi:hypothetical protein
MKKEIWSNNESSYTFTDYEISIKTKEDFVDPVMLTRVLNNCYRTEWHKGTD